MVDYVQTKTQHNEHKFHTLSHEHFGPTSISSCSLIMSMTRHIYRNLQAHLTSKQVENRVICVLTEEEHVPQKQDEEKCN